MNDHFVPAEETRTEIKVVNSRFIGTIAPVFQVDEAKAFVRRVKEEFAEATHNVPAFIIGHGASVIAHCNDDGEPAGTAGRPALAVLQGSGLGDAAVVITRYFGGTKLGTGGLVRAYGDTVRAILQVVPVAAKVPTVTAEMSLPYNLFEQSRLLIENQNGQILDQVFAAEVTLLARFRREQFDEFSAALAELSHGQVLAEIQSLDEATLMPVDTWPGRPA